jgi:SNF2 family DNA or RNA helicase
MSINKSKHSSAEVSKIIEIVKNMFGKGAPTTYDSAGFNKFDYDNPLLRSIYRMQLSDPLTWDEIYSTLYILKRYKNTQLKNENLDQIESKINDQFSETNPDFKDINELSKTKSIRKIGPGNYGRNSYIVPLLDPVKIRKIIKEISEKIMSLPPEHKQDFSPYFSGDKIQAWKLFYPRSQPDIIEIHPLVEGIVFSSLKELGYNIENTSTTNSNQTIPNEPADTREGVFESKNTDKKKIKIVRDGNNYEIYFEYNPEMVNVIRNVKSRRSWDANKKCWILYSPSKETLKQLGEQSDRIGFNRNPFDQASSSSTISEDGNSRIAITCKDISAETNNNWLVSIFYLSRSQPEEFRKFLNESLRFCFVNSTSDINNKDPDIHTYLNMSESADGRFKYQRPTRGSLNDYARFIQCCESRGFDASELKRVISSLVSRGVIKQERLEGSVDGFDNKDQFRSVLEKFESNISRTKTGEQFALKDLQVHGIQFLYSRSSALLGDETGTGKTVQSIMAAQLRLMKENNIPFDADLSDPKVCSLFNKKCIVFTLPSVVSQYTKNIKEIIGLPENEVSNSFNNVSAMWKVLPYNDLSVSSRAKEVTDFLKKQAMDGKIVLCILDECHTIKNGSPSSRDPNGDHKKNKTTFNCQDITQYIPYVWGLSATIIANKPVDLYNQLRAVNHPLGKLDHGKFKGNFDPKTKNPSEKFANADKLRQILILQRIYIQRTKKMMEENLPNIAVGEKNVDLDKVALVAKINARMNSYKGRSSLNEQSAIRVELASAKAPKTLEFAKLFINQGKKVAIFTSFNESADIITDGLTKILAPMNKKVAQIRGNQEKSERDIIIQDFKSQNSEYFAIVINIAAGGTGIDLPNILTDVIFNDYDWSPAKDEQARGRFFRINSKDDVNVYYMIAKGTADEDIYEIVKQKIIIMELIQKLDEEQIERISEGKFEITENDKRKNELQAKLEEIDEKLEQKVEQIGKEMKKASRNININWYKISR